MESQSNDLQQNSIDKNIEFKDLEALLQRSFDNRDLQVVDYTATKLLPAGENYGSIMLKIDAKIRRNKNAKEEMLHLVGKTSSNSEAITEWPMIFKKEVFMYAQLMPFYRQLEREAGIVEENLINVLPSFIGFRNSLNDDTCEVDSDSVLLMDNLKVSGYYNTDKATGMDVDHARKALTSLARYHALGVAMRQKRPDFAEKARVQAQILGIDFSLMDNAVAIIREILMSIPGLKKHTAVIESIFEQAKNGGSWKTIPTEPWATITHGDFWTNNMLFHKGDGGKVDDVKFVDFQTYLYSSPLKDVCRLLGCSVDMEMQTDRLNELRNLYYDVFLNTLKRMDCDASLFTRESFDREMKIQALGEFSVCALSHKFFASEVIDDDKSNEENVNNVVNAKPNDAFIKRLIWLVEVYEKMKWF